MLTVVTYATIWAMSTSRPYHHGDLRETLLQTTRALLADVGVEGLSLREVSRLSGVSHTAAYNHFRDKASLVRAVVEAAFVRLATDLARARASTTDPFVALQRIGVAYVRFAYRNRAEFRIMFRPELCGVASADKATRNGNAYTVLVETIRTCQASGAIPPGPSEPIALAAWSMVHGLSSLIVDGPDPTIAPTLAAAEKRARQCGDALRFGLIARSGR